MGENSPHSLENPPGIGASSEVKDGDGLCPVEMSQVRHADAEGAARVLNACSRLTFPGFVLVVFWTGGNPVCTTCWINKPHSCAASRVGFSSQGRLSQMRLRWRHMLECRPPLRLSQSCRGVWHLMYENFFPVLWLSPCVAGGQTLCGTRNQAASTK